MGADQDLLPDDDDVANFALRLRALRKAAGNPSLRAIEAVRYSRTTLSEATSGRSLPSLPVTLALVSFLSGDTAEWEQRWRATKSRLDGVSPFAGVAPATRPEEVRDGADPDAAGCHDDARTVHARKIALTGRAAILGQIELRHSAAKHAAWGRFLGYDTLKHLAHRRTVEVLVSIERVPDGARREYRDVYWFDYHWCDLLVTGADGTDESPRLTASASIFLDGAEAGTGSTDPFPLP